MMANANLNSFESEYLEYLKPYCCFFGVDGDDFRVGRGVSAAEYTFGNMADQIQRLTREQLGVECNEWKLGRKDAEFIYIAVSRFYLL